MTDTTRPTFRLTVGAFGVLFRSRPRQIVVDIEPGDVLTFREKGRRERFSIPIDSAFAYAVRCATLRDMREKAEKKRTAREAAKAERQRKKLFKKQS